MDHTCTLCSYSTSSEFQWGFHQRDESHLLKVKVFELEKEIEQLKQDKAYGGLTRPGLDIEHRKNADQCQYVVFIDLNYIHSLNAELGEPKVDEMIKSAFSFAVREHDIVVNFGRVESGDEEAFLLRGDPEGFIRRLYENVRSNGLDGIAAYAEIKDHDLISSIETARSIVREEKKKRGVVGR